MIHYSKIVVHWGLQHRFVLQNPTSENNVHTLNNNTIMYVDIEINRKLNHISVCDNIHFYMSNFNKKEVRKNLHRYIKFMKRERLLYK
jgi:hypothetical protein